jgi:hypothetical protein
MVAMATGGVCYAIGLEAGLDARANEFCLGSLLIMDGRRWVCGAFDVTDFVRALAQVWHRVIQIVTNREDVQEYAAGTCFTVCTGSFTSRVRCSIWVSWRCVGHVLWSAALGERIFYNR